MGFKIKRLEENRSEALRVSRGRPPVPTPQPSPPRRLLEALAMPATPLDTNWSSDPAFTVGPLGWYRQGCWS